MTILKPAATALAAFAILVATDAAAATPADLQAELAVEARSENPSFTGFSSQRGENFFRTRHGGEWSCSSCHTENPAANGAHAVTRKNILPLAPAANAERFTNPGKTDKWFRRNCNDVLKRACSAQEKGDLIAYLLTVKP